jgi:hypothetical protein
MALNWTREPSRGKHGIYLIHNGIHYNALRLRDNQEDGEQKEESNIRKDIIKTQQRRTKEQDTPTQDIQNNLLKKNTHEEGGSRTQDKTNEKGKRKSEKHEALCEAEHRKTKKKKQTQKHNQQERKRHRETDTLRADAGKKVRNTVGTK